MSPHALFALLVGSLGLVFATTGYLTRFRGYHRLIAGFDASKVTDAGALARWVGGTSIALGGVCVVAAVIVLALPGQRALVTIALGVAIVAGTIVTATGCSRFVRR